MSYQCTVNLFEYDWYSLGISYFAVDHGHVNIYRIDMLWMEEILHDFGCLKPYRSLENHRFQLVIQIS